MKRRRRSDERVDVIVVVTADGTRLRCSVADVGREVKPYWTILDDSGAQYVGPPAIGDRSRAFVEKAIRGWWDELRANGDNRANNSD